MSPTGVEGGRHSEGLPKCLPQAWREDVTRRDFPSVSHRCGGGRHSEGLPKCLPQVWRRDVTRRDFPSVSHRCGGEDDFPSVSGVEERTSLGGTSQVSPTGVEERTSLGGTSQVSPTSVEERRHSERLPKCLPYWSIGVIATPGCL